MAGQGAAGTTAAEFQAVLHQSSDNQATLIDYSNITNELNSQNEGVNISLANSIWLQRNFNATPNFTSALQQYFRAQPYTADFDGDNSGAIAAINNWASRYTNGKIQDLVTALPLTTKLVLVDAIYFKSDWVHQFNVSDTRNETFSVDAQTNVTVPVMYYGKDYVPYYEDADLQAIELDYNGSYTMLVALPARQFGLQALENQIDPVKLKQITDNARQTQGGINVHIPKFTLAYGQDLVPSLKQLGLASAFYPSQADFSNIDGMRDLSIDAVYQKAAVRVDEQGTTAAAATYVGLIATSASMDDPTEFRADHPFVFYIIDKTTGLVMFMGRVNNPLDS